MRSEAEIRRQVETRLKRRGLLFLDGGLWLAVVFILSKIMPYSSFGTTLNSLLAVFMFLWTGIIGLHFLRTVYVELREWLVRRAIERERQFFQMRDAHEKRKRDDALPRLSDDGELFDFPETPVRSRKGD